MRRPYLLNENKFYCCIKLHVVFFHIAVFVSKGRFCIGL